MRRGRTRACALALGLACTGAGPDDPASVTPTAAPDADTADTAQARNLPQYDDVAFGLPRGTVVPFRDGALVIGERLYAVGIAGDGVRDLGVNTHAHAVHAVDGARALVATRDATGQPHGLVETDGTSAGTRPFADAFIPADGAWTQLDAEGDTVCAAGPSLMYRYARNAADGSMQVVPAPGRTAGVPVRVHDGACWWRQNIDDTVVRWDGTTSRTLTLSTTRPFVWTRLGARLAGVGSADLDEVWMLERGRVETRVTLGNLGRAAWIVPGDGVAMVGMTDLWGDLDVVVVSATGTAAPVATLPDGATTPPFRGDDGWWVAASHERPDRPTTALARIAFDGRSAEQHALPEDARIHGVVDGVPLVTRAGEPSTILGWERTRLVPIHTRHGALTGDVSLTVCTSGLVVHDPDGTLWWIRRGDR